MSSRLAASVPIALFFGLAVVNLHLAARAEDSPSDPILDDKLQEANKILGEDPKNGEALLRRGKIWLKKGDSQKALADVDSLLKLAPKSSEARVLRGQISGSSD